MGILHGPTDIALSLPCSHYYSQSPSYVRSYVYDDARGSGPVDRDVHACLKLKIEGLRGAPVPADKGIAMRVSADALELGQHRPKLILTSPPYFNVQKYAWDNWLRLWLLGVKDYRTVQSELFETGSIARYASLMHRCLIRFHTLLADGPDARLIMVVGDARFTAKGVGLQRHVGEDAKRYVIDEHINTSEIIADVASSVGFEVIEIIDDFVPFGNKGLSSSLAAAREGGRAARVYGSDLDRIIVLKKTGGTVSCRPKVLENSKAETQGKRGAS